MKWMADLSEKKKYRIGYTPRFEALLARGIAERQIAKKAATPVTSSDLHAAVEGLSQQDVTDIFREQTKSFFGLKLPDRADPRQAHQTAEQKSQGRTRSAQSDVVARSDRRGAPTTDMEQFNWTERGIVTKAQDQNIGCIGHKGCCWAFATVGAFEAAYALKNGILIGASEQYLLSCSQPVMTQSSDQMLASQPWDCDGGWWAFDMLVATSPPSPLLPTPGVPYRQDLPYTGDAPCPSSPISPPYLAQTWGYVGSEAAIPSNEDLKKYLCQYGPLVVAIFGDGDWINNEGAVIAELPNPVTDANGDLALNHAVVLVGWDNNQGDSGAWIIKNSWGVNYGIQGSGFLYIGYNTQNIGYSAAYVVAGPEVPISP